MIKKCGQSVRIRSDLIVVRTTTTQNRITLSGEELEIDITASSRGSVTIVSLGTEKLTIDANQESRVQDFRKCQRGVGKIGYTVARYRS